MSSGECLVSLFDVVDWHARMKASLGQNKSGTLCFLIVDQDDGPGEPNILINHRAFDHFAPDFFRHQVETDGLALQRCIGCNKGHRCGSFVFNRRKYLEVGAI